MTADAKGLTLMLIIVVDTLHLVGGQACQLNFLIPTTHFFNIAVRMDGDGGIEMVSMSGAIQDKIWEFRDITMFVTRQNEMFSVLWCCRPAMLWSLKGESEKWAVRAGH